MNLYRRFKWAFLGIVAEEVHDLDDTIEAVVLPPLAAVVAAGMWYFAHGMLTSGELLLEVVGVLATAIASTFTVLSVIAVSASVVYARQETELPENVGRYDG